MTNLFLCAFASLWEINPSFIAAAALGIGDLFFRETRDKAGVFQFLDEARIY